MRMKVSLLIILIYFSLFGVNLAAAADGLVSEFVDYHSAEADVTWRYWTNDGEQVVNGVFCVTLPDKYGLVIVDENSLGQRINGYRDLIAIYLTTGQVEYNYESIQLFKVYETLFYKLIESADEPDYFVGYETLGGRNTARYQKESCCTYWFDRETNIPLRVTDEQGHSVLSLRQYQVDANYKKGVEAFTLAVNDQGWDGVIRLAKESDHWFPVELQVGDGNSRITVTFSNWRLFDKPLKFKELEQLDNLLSQGQSAADEGNHEQVIKIFRQILNIDPFYIPAYMHLAFSYAHIGDFLGTVENYQQWLVLEPDNPTALNNLAYTYMLAETNLYQGINLAYKAVSIDPKSAYLDTLGYGYYLVKDYDKALYYLLQAEENAANTELLDIFRHLTLAYQALNDQEQVIYYQQRIGALVSGE